MLQRVCSVVDHSWRESGVRTKKWRSEPCGLNVTISASCDCSVAFFTTSLESQESYLTLRNLALQITWDFLRLHSTLARLYNAAASPASRLRSAGSLAIIIIIMMINQLRNRKHFPCFYRVTETRLLTNQRAYFPLKFQLAEMGCRPWQ